MRFIKGQRVRIKDGFTNDGLWSRPSMDSCIGKISTVLNIGTYSSLKYFVYFSNGCGAPPNKDSKRGWWFMDYMLEPINNQLTFLDD